jgi:hypothetical protein
MSFFTRDRKKGGRGKRESGGGRYFVNKLICTSFSNHYKCNGSGSLHATIHSKSGYLKIEARD